jgi:hypothetical protein
MANPSHVDYPPDVMVQIVQLAAGLAGASRLWLGNRPVQLLHQLSLSLFAGIEQVI